MEDIPMTKKITFAEILDDARKHYAEGTNWIDFSNRYFAPGSPFLPKTAKERKKFVESPEYKEIQEMKYKLKEQQPDVAGPGEAQDDLALYSGNLAFTVPKTLHRQLVQEAEQNGVSLTQWCIYKLSR
jgi:hypothetical protein